MSFADETTPREGPPSLDADAIRALEPAAIRARRRPRAILLVWAWETIGAALVATPLHAWARSVWGAHPDGDAVLFRPGGHALLTWLGDDGAALAIVARTTLSIFLFFVIFGQIITGTLAASLASGLGRDGRAPPLAAALRAGAAAFVPMTALGVLAAALEALLLGIGLFASSAVDQAFQASLGDAHAFGLRLAVLGIFVLGALLVGVFADLGRVALARDVVAGADPNATVRARMLAALLAAGRAGAGGLVRVPLAWGWRAALSLALVYAGGVAGDVVGGRGGGALVGLFVVHQLIVLARAGLRAAWLAHALRFVVARAS